LHRGSSGTKRRLVNEAAIEDLLARDGFVVINPEKQTAAEIVQACAGARIVVGVEGSQLIHGFMALQKGGAIVALMPPFRFFNHFKDLTDCIGLRYGMKVGSAADDGFHIDPNELRSLLDKVETGIS
jgi:capsular polysaccharide biosynthesis protein